MVVASTSRGGIKEALLGSVAASLVHHCDVPVVVLHRPQEGGGQAQLAAKRQSEVAWLLSATAEDLSMRAETGLQARADVQRSQQVVRAVQCCSTCVQL